MIFSNYNQLISNGSTEAYQKKRKDILTLLSTALETVNPYQTVIRHIQDQQIISENKTIKIQDYSNIYLIGFGKASVKMANAICDSLPIISGAVITNDQISTVSHPNITTYHGDHPIPSEKNLEATKSLEKIISQCTQDDLLLVCISGGGSALLTHPLVPIQDLQITTKMLLSSGATIHEINTIRKHLSKVKGGQLLRNVNCKTVSLIISDVVGDPLEFIASGPTCGDSTTFADAYQILKNYQLLSSVPSSVKIIIENGKSGLIPETPKPEDPLFKQVNNFIIANNTLACTSIREKAKSLGYHPLILTSELTGESREIGPELLQTIKDQQKHNEYTLFIAGGETTVTVNGSGKGGRNQEMVLSMIKPIADTDFVCCSFATDGIDGMSTAAGAICDGKSYTRAQDLSLAIEKYLSDNDSNSFFHAMNDLIITGLTGTNVMDVQIIIP